MWTKKRHRAVFAFLRPIMRVYTRWKYGYTAKKCRLEKRPYLVISNHQTGFDQFLIALSFKRPLYYIASDDIFSNKYSGIIEFLVAPIPKSKSAKDLEPIRNCYRIAKEGGTICVFAEGNRTFSGATEYIEPSIAKLIRMLRLPVVFYRFSGGYGVQPRWARSLRKGRMTGEVTSIMPEEEWSKLTEEQLYQTVCERLAHSECAVPERYRSKALAEYLERAYYYCPDCGGFGDWHSEGDLLTCRSCGRTVRYTEHNAFETLKKKPDTPAYTTTKEWYDDQVRFARAFDFGRFGPEEEIFGDEEIRFVESVRCKKKVFLCEGRLSFFAGYLTIGKYRFDFNEITGMTVLGKNKVNFYSGGRIYQLQPPPRFCAVRLVNLFYAYKIKTGENEDGFMGL